MRAPRKPVLAGNWKMHKGPGETLEFFSAFLAAYPLREDRGVVFFPPALSLDAALAASALRPDIRCGVQSVHWEASGALTGEISASLAAASGAELALVGHSERRHLFGETDEETARKVRAVQGAGLVAVLCVGERIDARRAGRAEAVVEEQLTAALAGLSRSETPRLLIAYEPVWAIGTGETASPADARSMHAFIRGRLHETFGEKAGAGVAILYGGSVKPENAAELMSQPDVDGVLVGGASLDPASFAAICAAAG